MTLFYLGLAWLAGIFLACWLEPPFPVLGLLTVPALAAALLYRREYGPRLAALCALALIAGAARLLWATPRFGPGDLAYYNDQGQVRLVGVVADEPDVRDSFQNLRLRAESMTRLASDGETGGEELAVKGTVLVRAPRYPARAYGERLAVTGELETPPIFEGFDYRDYLARQGVYAMIRRPQIELIEAGRGSPFWAALYAFKARAQETIAQILPEPYAALLTGILLGVETGIPRPLYERFNATGTSHIIVISGFNIAIVAGLFMLVGTRLFGKRRAAWVAIAGIVLYTLLVGADAAVVRAAIMGGLFVLALYLGRQTEVRTSLVLAAFVMTALNPYALWDVGFQLSFAATAGLIWLTPPLERVAECGLRALVGRQHVRAGMRLVSEAVLVTLAAQIATGPLVVYHFGRLSLISLLTNLLILPVQPLVMTAGGLATLAGMLWLPAGKVIGWLAWLPLAWSVWVVDWTVTVPFASLALGSFSPWLLAIIYTGLILIVWWANRSPPSEEVEAYPPVSGRLSLSTRLLFSGGVLTVALVWLAVASLPDNRLHVAFLDVGQGDAILITTPHGQQMLIDGGPSAAVTLWQMGRHIPFWDRSLDLVVNTHPEADHLTGLPEVLRRYRVDQVILPDVGNDTSLYAAWQTALAAEGAMLTPAQAGMRLSSGDGVWVEVLHPGLVSGSDRLNDHSVVLRVGLGRVSFLLPGDIEADMERKLAGESVSLGATVLKAPHHGSNTSSCEPFLAAVDPQVAVVSVGADNTFGHPSPEVLARYAGHNIPVLRTDELGSIEFVTDGERLWVKARR
ncbi:MAG: DNA internalization-related competence protein ComEC/Rec2 [Anaerolineae bacterium]